MTKEQRKEITDLSKRFAKPFYKTFGGINGTGWLIVDPLAGYLGMCGYEVTMKEIPETEHNTHVLVICFKDGDQFIPAGGDLMSLHSEMKNWMWL